MRHVITLLLIKSDNSRYCPAKLYLIFIKKKKTLCTLIFFPLILHHNMKRPPLLPIIIGTGFGSGFWPWGPGTAGALLATGMWSVLSFFLSSSTLFFVTLALVIVLTALGTWATQRLMPFWGDDPSRVVADEMVGVWIPLLACPTLSEGGAAWGYCIAAFVLFRLFDIFKPLGIRKIDNMKGAFYVMADDILAGTYSLIIIIAARWAI